MHHTLPIISFVSCSPTLSSFIHPNFVMFTSEECEHRHGHKKRNSTFLDHTDADKWQTGSTVKFLSYR